MTDRKPGITRPEKPYVSEYGNIDVYGGYCKYLEAVDWELFRTMNPMPITGAFSSNPWNALIEAGIYETDVEDLKRWSKNHCPCSEMDYYAMVPVCILTSDANRYIGDDEGQWYYNLLSDGDWNRYQNWGVSNERPEAEIPENDPEKHLGSVKRAMLGSGYTEMILPSDGSHDFIFASIPLDNGDKVIIIGWEWYNK